MNAYSGDIKFRTKRAPTVIHSPLEALEAFERIKRYDEMTAHARDQSSRYTDRTATAQRNALRAQHYRDIADSWRNAPHAWLQLRADLSHSEAMALRRMGGSMQ